jgi:hypothetical protein
VERVTATRGTSATTWVSGISILGEFSVPSLIRISIFWRPVGMFVVSKVKLPLPPAASSGPSVQAALVGPYWIFPPGVPRPT